jgi:hypothetical protein
MSRTKSFEEATDSLLAGSANLVWRDVNSNEGFHRVLGGFWKTKAAHFFLILKFVETYGKSKPQGI